MASATLGTGPSTSAPAFDPLIKALDRGLRLFEGLSPSVAAAVEAEAQEEVAPPAAAPAHRASAAAGPGVTGAIRSPDDVRQMISKICDYYTANEPSSPVPILLMRAQSLIGKSFLDLIDNLTPNGRSELNVLMGPESNS